MPLPPPPPTRLRPSRRTPLSRASGRLFTTSASPSLPSRSASPSASWPSPEEYEERLRIDGVVVEVVALSTNGGGFSERWQLGHAGRNRVCARRTSVPSLFLMLPARGETRAPRRQLTHERASEASASSTATFFCCCSSTLSSSCISPLCHVNLAHVQHHVLFRLFSRCGSNSHYRRIRTRNRHSRRRRTSLPSALSCNSSRVVLTSTPAAHSFHSRPFQSGRLSSSSPRTPSFHFLPRVFETKLTTSNRQQRVWSSLADRLNLFMRPLFGTVAALLVFTLYTLPTGTGAVPSGNWWIDNRAVHSLSFSSPSSVVFSLTFDFNLADYPHCLYDFTRLHRIHHRPTH